MTATAPSNRAERWTTIASGRPATPGQLQQDSDQAITRAIDSHVQAEQRGNVDDGHASAWANGDRWRLGLDSAGTAKITGGEEDGRPAWKVSAT